LSSIAPNNELDELDKFFEDNDSSEEICIQDTSRIFSKQYNYLNSSFKILTGLMEGNSTKEDILYVESFFTDQISKFSTKVRETDMNKEYPSSTNFISSNPPSSKKGNTIVVVDFKTNSTYVELCNAVQQRSYKYIFSKLK